MTTLRKAVRREVRGLLREDLIVSLYPGGVIGIRAKRTRREYQLPLVTVYRLAIDAARERQRRDRALGEGWGLNARRKRLEVERRRLANPACPVRYCACGCGARIPVALEDARGPGRFVVRGHSQKRPGRTGETHA